MQSNMHLVTLDIALHIKNIIHASILISLKCIVKVIILCISRSFNFRILYKNISFRIELDFKLNSKQIRVRFEFNFS